MKEYTQLSQTELASQISPNEFSRMQEVEKVFPFQSNDYYLSLINPDDRHDPIRKIILPDPQELESIGSLDPSDEKSYTVLPGVQHKYNQTVLFMAGKTCGGICRFCFRKRLFCTGKTQTTGNISQAMDYVQEKPGVTDILLSGGDPLLLSASNLDDIFTHIREVPHICNIRIGSKLPAYDPRRIVNNTDLLEVIHKHTLPESKIHLMSHYNHPAELTDVSRSAIHSLKRNGAEILNQTPIIKGVNDSPHILSLLFNNLTKIGVAPYYIFQCRPTSGNYHLTVPIEQSLWIIQEAQALCSGLAKRARYIMSHKSGKIEILGKSAKYVYMKYHQMASLTQLHKILRFRPNPQARWLEDYECI